MRILYKEGKLDLWAPIFASEEQREKIIDYFKTNFQNVEIMNIKEDGKTFSERSRSEMKKWTKEEFVDLLRIGNLDELKEITGRSDMSIKMKLGELMPEFLSWARENGYDSYIDEKKIKEFIEQRVKE
jgi:hypothetical protein